MISKKEETGMILKKRVWTILWLVGIGIAFMPLLASFNLFWGITASELTVEHAPYLLTSLFGLMIVGFTSVKMSG